MRINGMGWSGALILMVLLIGTGLGARQWTVAHVEHYTGDVVRTKNCAACHFSARGGTILDRLLRPRYRSPLEIAACPDGSRLYVTAQDADSLLVIDPDARRLVSEIPVGRRPHGVALGPDCAIAWVTNHDSDTVSEIDLVEETVLRTLPTGAGPAGVALGPGGDRLFVANLLGDDISVLDLPTGTERARLAAGNDPLTITVSPDGRRLLVTNQLALPSRRPDPPASEVTVIDPRGARVASRLLLPNAHLLEGAAFAPGGDLALVALVRPKNLLPALQVERGWMMVNGVAVIDWKTGAAFQLPLDEADRSFADPSGVVFTPDGRYAFVSHGGVDRITAVDLASLRERIREIDPEDPTRDADRLDLTAGYVRARIPTGSNPRGMAVSPDGRWVYVAERLADRIGVVDAHRMRRVDGIDLGGPRHLTLRRLGEKVFHSADVTLQGQFSCRSCHPGSHVDNLTYDFEPDGLGRNVVDNRSLLGIRDTGPFKWNGKNTSLYMQCGIRFARFLTRSQPFAFGDLNALVAYIGSLEPPENRHRDPESGLTPAQQRGKRIFERSRTVTGEEIPVPNRCLTCHPPPLYTHFRKEDVGSASPEDSASAYDTPQLNNVVNTSPYLHDGKAMTLEEIWTLYSPEDTHGVVGDIGKEGLNDLVEYLKTL